VYVFSLCQFKPNNDSGLSLSEKEGSISLETGFRQLRKRTTTEVGSELEGVSNIADKNNGNPPSNNRRKTLPENMREHATRKGSGETAILFSKGCVPVPKERKLTHEEKDRNKRIPWRIFLQWGFRVKISRLGRFRKEAPRGVLFRKGKMIAKKLPVKP